MMSFGVGSSWYFGRRHSRRLETEAYRCRWSFRIKRIGFGGSVCRGYFCQANWPAHTLSVIYPLDKYTIMLSPLN